MSTDLPQLDAEVFLADGGLETTLVFDDGIDLPDFAAFGLLDDAAGRQALVRYYDSYAAIAAQAGVGIVLDTPTWRASTDWAARQGFTLEDLIRLNQDAVALLADTRRRHATSATPVVISGAIGPRGDGYQAGELMSVDEARSYHGVQARAFADAGVDQITAVTMTNRNEGQGVVEAARAVGIPVVISFTVETDGTLCPAGRASVWPSRRSTPPPGPTPRTTWSTARIRTTSRRSSTRRRPGRSGSAASGPTLRG